MLFFFFFSRTGAGSGVDFIAVSMAETRRVGCSVTAFVAAAVKLCGSVTATMASSTTGLESTGEMPAALAEINGRLSKLEASLKSRWPTRLRGSGLAAILWISWGTDCFSLWSRKSTNTSIYRCSIIIIPSMHCYSSAPPQHSWTP